MLVIAVPGAILWQIGRANAAGTLTVEIIAGYNLVVDSNVLSPSTYAPSAATVIGKFCNTGSTALTGVQGFIGNYTAGTPGIYPTRATDSGGSFDTQHPHLAGTPGSYSFTHVGGRIGTTDATRFIGTLAAGECKVQYWHFSYPRRSNLASSNDNLGPKPVWGETRLPGDDLWLTFDIWGTSAEGSNNNTSWTMTMRNEISAMANKIEPNPNGQWFNTDSSIIRPGEVITSNGILYDLGNINKGFDNDGDFVYDYNAWLQPIGDPSYDPSCFRLIRTTGVLTVSRSAGKPDLITSFQDDLYFMNLPADNTGVLGQVHYAFLALDGPCSTSLTPYQEVASGADNEKFNADYGTGIPPVGSSEIKVTVDKTSNPTTVALGGTVTYEIPIANTGSTSAGLPLYSVPVVVSDTLPAGTELVGSSVSASFSYANSGVTVLYSTDNGATWSATEPSPASNTTDVQVWLKDTMPAGGTGTVSFQVTVPGIYSGSAFIENNACAQFGSGASFDCDSAMTMVSGSNSIGDLVWKDDDGDGVQDGGETGIANVTVSLYWDRDGDGALDTTDPLITTTTTNSSGAYSFSSLPNGNFLVQVDTSDTDIPTGNSPTNQTLYAVTLSSSSYTAADFGFGPVLQLDKQQTSSTVSEGSQHTYTIELTNLRPGDGTGQGSSCTYTVWAAAEDTGHSGSGPSDSWTNPSNAFGAGGPDNTYASSAFANALDKLAGTNFSLGSQAGSIASVEVLYSIYMAGQITNDSVELYAWYNDAQIATQVYNPATALNTYGNGQSNQGLLTWNVTSARSWSWSDFNGTFLDIGFYARKSGQGDTTLYMDAMGFRVTTNQTCGGSSDTIATLPLTDTYDADLFSFVSADPSQTSVSTSGTPPNTVGTITWSNVGPLYAGQTKTITVTFTALEPASEASVSTTNTAGVTGAQFGDGSAVNDASDSVGTTINPTGSIGDRIWYDSNGDGLQDGGELGIPNVTVRLCDNATCSGTVFGTTTTDASGNYLFSGLADGTSYYVVVTTSSLPGGSTGWSNTGDPESDNNSRSNALTINNTDGISTNNDYSNIDFGYRRTTNAIIFGNVWQDHNGNGSQGSGENGIGSVTVELFSCGANGTCGDGDDGAAVASTTTDSSGDYTFTGVSVTGNHYVKVGTTTLPSGGTWTNTVDPEGTPGDSQTNAINIAAGGFYGAYDFGYYRTGSYTIGNTLYADWNGNGSQNSGEEGIANITVSLYEDADGDGQVDSGTDALIATTTTDASGNYSFTSLAGSAGGIGYTVVVDTNDTDFPSGYKQTQDPDETGVCSTCDSRAKVTLTTADVDTVDFGYQPTGYGSIGDFVWQDTDHDGVQDSGESGIANITVSLYEDSNNDNAIDSGDALVATTPTDASGNYTFSDLPAGNYLVDVDTTDADLPTDSYGNRYVLSTGNDPADVTLAAAEDYTSADFGFTAGGIIGDLLWQDNDGDGTIDTSEPGIANVTVNLYNDVNSNGVYDDGTDTLYGSDVTDSDGIYEFTSLPAGDYVVVVDTTDSDLPSTTVTGDPDVTPPCGTCNSQSGVTLTAGQVDRSRDFGYQPGGVIGDTLWIDTDNDGTRDADEPGVAGITVTLKLGATPVMTTTTDSDGYYSFGNVANNTYTVVVDSTSLPSGLSQTYDPDGTLDNQASVTISSGSSDLTRDFGYRYSGAYSISGTVFFDAGNDGGLYQSGTDTPYGNITVYLWRNSALIGTTTTDGNGLYTFSSLSNGDYAVSVNRNSQQLTSYTLKTPATNPYYQPVTISGANQTQKDFGFNATMDFGDLPTAYSLTKLAHEGARHTISGPYLGTSPSADADGQEHTTAAGDTDDGVSVTNTPWSNGANGAGVNVIVGGCSGTCYLSAWLDWNNDGDFGDTGERILLDQTVSNGTQTVTFDVPAGTFGGGSNLTFNARFRLYGSSTNSLAQSTGLASDGEVEDYQWSFGPTAVTLSGFTARPVNHSPGGILVIGTLILLGTAWWLRWRH